MADVAPAVGATGVLRRVAAVPTYLFLYVVAAGVLTCLTVAAGAVWMSAALKRQR